MADRRSQPSPTSHRKFIVINKLMGRFLISDSAVTMASATVLPGEIFDEVCVLEDHRPGLEQLSCISIERKGLLLECSIRDVLEIGSFAVGLLLPLDLTKRLHLLSTDRLDFASTCQPDSEVTVFQNNSAYPAVVRFVGALKGKGDGLFFGVELPHHIGHGDCEGSFNGIPYFRCKPGGGFFVTVEHIAPPNETIASRNSNGMDPSRRMINTSDDSSSSSYFVRGGLTATPVGTNGIFPASGEIKQMPIGKNIQEEAKKAFTKLGIFPAVSNLANSTMNLGSQMLSTLREDRQPSKEQSSPKSSVRGVPQALPIEALQGSDIKPDSRVHYYSDEGVKLLGTVRWIGYVDNKDPKEEITAGLELDKPFGSGTGVLNGNQLFVAIPNHACFVPLSHLSRLSDEPTVSWTDVQNHSIAPKESPIKIQNGQVNGLSRKLSYSDVLKKPSAPASFSSSASTSSSVSSVRSDGIQATPEVSGRLAVRFPRQSEGGQPRQSSKPLESQHSRRSPSENRRYTQQPEVDSGEKNVGCFHVPSSKSHNKFPSVESQSNNTQTYVREALSVHPNPSPEKAAIQRQEEKVSPSEVTVRFENNDVGNRSLENRHLRGRKGRLSAVPTRDLTQRRSPTPPPLRPVASLRRLEYDQTSGRRRGIQGHKNSCYMDATLFSMFAFSNVFEEILERPRGKGNIQGYEEVQDSLREYVVEPLKKNFYVDCEGMMAFREVLDKVGDVEGLTDREKDPEELLHTLLEHILTIDPLLKMTTMDANWYTLFVEKDYKKPIPTIQELLDQSLVESDVRFKEVPRCLILQTPRSGAQYKMYRLILPSATIDITDAVIGSSRTCSLCQDEKAELECKECFGWTKTTDANQSASSSTAFCRACFTVRHKKLPSHRPKELPVPKDASVPQDRITMELFAVLCIKTSHYVTFAKDGEDVWHFMDSMADREGGEGNTGFNIPEVTLCFEVNEFLGPEGHKKLMEKLERNEQLAEPVNRFFEDCYLCMYQPTTPNADGAQPAVSNTVTKL